MDAYLDRILFVIKELQLILDVLLYKLYNSEKLHLSLIIQSKVELSILLTVADHNLNKVCPKDISILLHIDNKVFNRFVALLL